MTPAVEAALEAARPLSFYCVKFVFPAATVRLLSGDGTFTVDGEVYTGGDATYGVLAGLEAFADGVDAEAPVVRLTLQPPYATTWTTLRDPSVQGSAVTIYEGVVERTTGLVVADPELAFVGYWDTVEAEFAPGSLSLKADIISVFDRFFEVNEGARLCDPWHQSFWPGEKGLDQVTGITKRLPWGVGGGGTGFKGRKASEFDWNKVFMPGIKDPTAPYHSGSLFN